MSELSEIIVVLTQIRDELRYANNRNDKPDPQLKEMLDYLQVFQEKMKLLWEEREERIMLAHQLSMRKQ